MMNEEKFIELSPRLYDIGRTLFNQYQQQIIQADAVASGNLLNSNWNIEQDDKHLALVFNLPDYWKTIEYGRQPTKKWIDCNLKEKIKEWILIKGISLKPIQLKNGEQRQPTIDSVAYAITQKIHKEGYKARHPLEKALNNNKALINEFVDISAEMFTKPIQADINDLYNIQK